MDQGTQIFFENFRLDPENACLWRDTEALPLSPKVFAVLSYLLSHAGRLVTRDELLRTVWPDIIVGEAALTVCIREIRKLLGDQAKSPRFIETRHRHGYRFIAATSTINPARAEHCSSESHPDFDSPLLVGREMDLAQLETYWEKSLRGNRQIVFVTGEPGIGKTTLLRGFHQRMRARGDVWMAHGHCFEHFGLTEPYLPVLEAINQLCHQSGGSRLVSLLSERAPMWLAQLPSLRNTARPEVVLRETFGATPERMLREMVEALESFTAQIPLVLMLEDLHWSDFATLDLISALARRRQPARLLIIGTYRPVEVIINDHPLHALKQDLRTHHHHQCQELPVELLTQAAVAEYLALRFPGGAFPAALAALIHERTCGNPLFMVSVVDDLLARKVLVKRSRRWQLREGVEQLEIGVPESIRPIIERQFERLRPEEQKLLEAASIAGMEFSAALPAAALDEAVVSVEETCDRLARRHQFLREAGVNEWPDGTVAGGYRFLHWLYQDVLSRRVSAARTRQFHQRLGERLEAAFEDQSGTVAAELARHFALAGDDRRAIRSLGQSAENACRRYASRETLHCLEQALQLIERLPEPERGAHRLTVLEQRGRLRRFAGDMAGSAEDFLAAADSAKENAQAEVRALLGAAASLFFLDPAKSLAVAERAVDCSRHISDPLLQAHARGQLSHWRIQVDGWTDQDGDNFRECIALARQHQHSELLGLYLVLGAFHRCHQSDYEGACAVAEEGLPLVQMAGDVYHYMSGICFAGWAFLHRGEWGEAKRRFEDGLRIAEKNGHPLAERVFRLFLAWLHEEAFDFETARELCESRTSLDMQVGTSYRFILHARSLLGLGETERAFDCFCELRGLTEQGLNLIWCWRLLLHFSLSEYWFTQGELGRARDEAELTCQLASQSGERTYLALGRRTLAEIAIAEQNWDVAENELSDASLILQGRSLPLAEWRVSATDARLHQRRHRRAEAEESRGRSRAVLQRLADSLGESSSLRRRMLANLPE